MPIGRVFLDWSKPALTAAAEYLVERFASAGELDLGSVVLALPGARAGRRLLEILVEQAEQHKLALCPPRIVTAGKLPELLYEAKRPFACELTQQLAWVEALRAGDREQLQDVVPTPPVEEDRMAWLSLGAMLARLHRELAAEALDFPAVAQCGTQIAGFREKMRWRALAGIQVRYLRALDRFGLWDRQTARLVAVRNGECHSEAQIVLVGTVDLSRVERMMLDQVADHATALVFAPNELADRFDEHGCLRPAAWLSADISLSAGQIEVVGGPAEQAEAVIRALASFDRRYSTEQISIGVPDEQVVPYLEQRLRQSDLPARYGVGIPAARSAPCRLLAAVADYLETSRFAAFAALVRHPWVHQWLASQKIPDGWLIALDRYYTEHMPHHLDGNWQAGGHVPIALGKVHRAIEQLCHELRAKPKPLAEWAQPLLDLLVGAFGAAPLAPGVEPDRTLLAACQHIREALEEHATIPAELMPVLGSTEAIRLVLGQVDRQPIPPLPDRGGIELLGWLELPLDDAPALIVTGFNEGRVPASLNSDLFLPNQLRRALGVEDNDRRYARDAYALSVLAASREELRLIAGRRNADGDPLLPSRLLFACDEGTIAERVLAFFSGGESGPARPKNPPPGLTRSRLDIPKPRPLAEPVTSMRVTEFKDYLACPYRYYLRHVLKLESVSDSAAELDGAAFGLLAHEVLGEFGKSHAALTDVEEIRQRLGQLLDEAVLRSYGTCSMPSILVQAEQLRLRLDALARWQAEWRSQGWRIEHVEVSPEDAQACILVDGQPMFLRGRIDRIDVHEPSGKRMIFDYKTSDLARTPDQAHRQRGEWIDLQLPLYRHLAAGLGITGPVDLAYIILPKDTSRVGHSPADWAPQELASADRAAEEVVRAVRAQRFWPPAVPPPAFAEDFAAICQDDRFGAVLAADDAQGGAKA